MGADGCLAGCAELMPDIRRYARLIVERGAALQHGQTLIVASPPDALDFARLLAEEAYRRGAGDVQVRMEDQEIRRLRLAYAGYDELVRHLRGEAASTRAYAEAGACFVRLFAGAEAGLSAADAGGHGQAAGAVLSPERRRLIAQAEAEAGRELGGQLAFASRRQGSAVPTAAWARRVFPHVGAEQALRQMWHTILHLARMDDGDGLSGWDRHMAGIARRREKLDACGLTALRFRNALGTDLTVGLAEDAAWVGGTVGDAAGIAFCPCVPTEEVFTAPHAAKVNGRVCSSIPLYHGGTRISGFSLTFKDGEVVSCEAEEGEEALLAILDTDAGSRRLGEVALVSARSRVARMDTDFYETLCDENRACHLALGAAYPGSVGGSGRGLEELAAKGLNRSAVHVDFMFGTDDLDVTGTAHDGREIAIMREGEFISGF